MSYTSRPSTHSVTDYPCTLSLVSTVSLVSNARCTPS